MKKILSNPAAFFMLIVLIVTICVISIPFIVRSVKLSNAKSFYDSKICCMCEKDATKNMGLSKFYCDDCFYQEYGDVPVHQF